MPDLSDGYHNTRRRVSELVTSLDAAALSVRVPACPDWTVHQLVAHMAGIPEALTSGSFPAGDLQAWLDAVVKERQDVPVPELLERWEACESGTSSLVDGGASLMFIDVVSHEHDLRGAVGRGGARGTPEVRATVQLLLDLLAPAITEAGLGALVVDSGEVRWASQFVRPGCTLRVDPWEAIRVLQSRRTADEIRALPLSGDVEPYLAVLADHSPL
ncbi:MAG: hypothetical protein JWN29_3607, partial [Acidimicrobiales bacterium]|nr:hypothetical protein [Acidimicrobiales bacterium]